MGIYNNYDTDIAAENDGVWCPFENGLMLRLGRAGGSNRRYIQAIARRSDEFKGKETSALMESGALAGVYADGVVFDKEDPNGELVTRDGAPIEIGSPEMEQALRDLPELFMEVQRYAGPRRLYRVLDSEPEGDEAGEGLAEVGTVKK